MRAMDLARSKGKDESKEYDKFMEEEKREKAMLARKRTRSGMEEDVEVKDVEKAEADDFDDEGNKNITFEGVSYKVDSDGDVLNPED